MSGSAETLIDSMSAKVWSLEVSKAETNDFMKKYKVANVRNISGGAELRIISAERPSPNAVLEEATLEDVFLYYFGEKAGEQDVSI